ncbi:MAG: DUF1295 domain-containing protein [Candidatus Saccharibacteria bacterium]|nr:DUF1295 domain-containing protein [Candidatus Saccharibacteria bacterium]
MILIYTLLLALALNIAAFAIAYSKKSDKLTDFTYGLTFFLIALLAYTQGAMSTPQAILLLLVTLWAVRISAFLLIRILSTGKDNRFNDIRQSFWKFGAFWLLQGCSAWVIMLPSIYFLSGDTASFTGAVLVGVLIWSVGYLFETVADYQKFTFKQNKANKGKWIQNGLWAYSRHPNYFGEITMWVGIYILAISTISGTQQLIALASPLWIFILLRFVSGTPKLETYADKRWGDNKSYQAYKRKTPLLIPKLFK